MLQITVKIDGMMCGMCEAHVNDAIRKAFPVKKVSASHSKGPVSYTHLPVNGFIFQPEGNAPEVESCDISI